MSEGFHPKAKFSFPLALATGIIGEQEVMEVEFDEAVEADGLLQALNERSPAGLSFTSVELLEQGTAKLQPAYVEYRIELPADREVATRAKIDELLSQPSFEIRRPGRKQPIDVLADLETLEITEQALRFVQRITRQAGFQPRELLEILGLSDLESQGMTLRRSSITWSTPTTTAAS